MKIIKNHPLESKSPEEYGILALIGHYTSLESSVEAELERYRDERFSLSSDDPKYQEKVADNEKAQWNVQHRKNRFTQAKMAALECLQVVSNAKFIRLVEESKKKKS